MRIVTLLGIFLATAFAGATLFALAPVPPPPAVLDVQDDMAAAAQAFLATLEGDALDRARYAFDDDERYNWHYVPKRRNGLPLKEMTLDQRRAAHHLLRTTLSAKGYLKATSIMYLESILRILENGAAHRDPEMYYFTVFGEPGGEAPWGWRIEGHHLSITFTSVGDELRVTPAFMGANPGEVRSGPYTGLRVLAEEEDLGRALMLMLDDGQRRAALIMAEAPDEVITGADRQARLEGFEGLRVGDMTADQQSAVRRILEAYVHNMTPDVAAAQMARIEAAGLEHLHFAWAGSTTPGEGHYYRLHGPTVLFEFDNVQNGNNHPHAVWRDFDGDYGEDLLRKHHEEHH